MEKNDLTMREKYRRLPEDDERRRLLEKDAPYLLSTVIFKNTGVRMKPYETLANIKLRKVQLEKNKAEY